MILIIFDLKINFNLFNYLHYFGIVEASTKENNFLTLIKKYNLQEPLLYLFRI